MFFLSNVQCYKRMFALLYMSVAILVIVYQSLCVDAFREIHYSYKIIRAGRDSYLIKVIYSR